MFSVTILTEHNGFPQESWGIHKPSSVLPYRKEAVYYCSPCHLLGYQVYICSLGNDRVGSLLETGLQASNIPFPASGSLLHWPLSSSLSQVNYCWFKIGAWTCSTLGNSHFSLGFLWQRMHSKLSLLPTNIYWASSLTMWQIKHLVCLDLHICLQKPSLL